MINGKEHQQAEWKIFQRDKYVINCYMSACTSIHVDNMEKTQNEIATELETIFFLPL